MGHFLHRIAEGEGLVGGLDADGGAVVDLELRGRVFAIMGDEIEADALEIAQDDLDGVDIGVARGVEDMHAAEERLQRLAIEEIELVFMSHHHVEAELGRCLDQAAQHIAGRGFVGRVVLEGDVADDLGRVLLPGHPAQGGEIGKELGIRVADLVVETGARDDVGGGVEREDPAVEIEPLAGIALDRIDGHQLRAGDGVEIGQLETDELDPVGPQRRHLLGDIVLLAPGHAPLPCFAPVFIILNRIRGGRLA